MYLHILNSIPYCIHHYCDMDRPRNQHSQPFNMYHYTSYYIVFHVHIFRWSLILQSSLHIWIAGLFHNRGAFHICSLLGPYRWLRTVSRHSWWFAHICQHWRILSLCFPHPKTMTYTSYPAYPKHNPYHQYKFSLKHYHKQYQVKIYLQNIIMKNIFQY